MPLTLFGVATISFVVLRVIPGDPAIQLAGDTARRQDVELIRRQLGLDQPIWRQYVDYLGQIVTGDLGDSFRTRTPVTDEVLAKIGATLQLGVAATLLTAIVGMFTGVVAAYARGRLLDRFIFLAGIIGLSLPSFWLGLVLIWLFAVKINVFPVAGNEGPRSLVLPALSLALGPIAIMARTVRSSMMEVLQQEFVRTARAKGLAESVVVLRHAFRNALIPAVTLIGLNFGSLLAGAVIVEMVFSWPGLGRLLVDALQNRDFPIIQGVTLTLAALFLVANLVVDLAYSALDPRIRYG